MSGADIKQASDASHAGPEIGSLGPQVSAVGGVQKGAGVVAESASLTPTDNKTASKVAIATAASHNMANPAPQTAAQELPSTTRSETEPWHRRLNPLRRKMPAVPEERLPSREFHANFLSKLIFHWIAPLMRTGYRRPLELNDIWLVNPDRSTEAIESKLSAAFKDRVARGSKRPLLAALYSTLKVEFLVGGLSHLVATIMMTVSPFVLKYLIAFAAEAYTANENHTKPPPIGHGMGLVIGITLMQIITSFGMNHFIYRGMTVGGQARAGLMAMIFDKAMRISGRAKAGGSIQDLGSPPDDAQPGSEKERAWYKKALGGALKKGPPGAPKNTSDGVGWSNGRIVNLMSVDTYRIDQASGMFHMTWTSPLAVLITMALLLVNLSYSALPGIGLLILSTPVLGRAVRAIFRRRAAINKLTDQRVSLTQEILQSVRFVKYFGWETSFLERIDSIRKREIHSIQILLAIRDAINAISMCMPVFASMLSFITYSLSHNLLTPAPIFSSLALFNSLRMPLNFLPLVIGQAVDGYASIKRIQEFLLAEEAPDESSIDDRMEDAIVIQDGGFTWEKTQGGGGDDGQQQPPSAEPNANDTASMDTATEPFQLRGLNLSLGRSELIAVIGNVGSGKSSLLSALAGDMRKTSGSVTFGASRAFCPQYAWIQNATVRNNIVFGKEFKSEYYEKVIDACALRPDLEMLPHGDMTEIGERGITVSGGQKQRLNIARAIYFDADIVLLDDPLSAVDAHVGRHLMDNAICGLLANKCRVLATHQLHVIHRCDRVIWMDDGAVKAVGTFNDLLAENEGFIKLMAAISVDEKESDENAEDDDDEDEEIEPGKVASAKASQPAAALMQTEERAVSGVSWGVYLAYLRATGSVLVAPLALLLLILPQGCNIVTSLWLSWWTAQKFDFNQGTYIGVYAGLGGMQAVLMFLYSVSISFFGTQACKAMLHKAMTQVLRAPMSFFDTTPLGRIVNRFSKDIDVMDNNLTDAIRMYSVTMGMIISVFILIIAYYYYFLAALVPLLVMFLWASSYYRRSAREIKRHEAVLRSVVFARFSEAIYGTSTIRAYGLQDQFSSTIRQAIDSMDGAYFITFSNQRWLSIRVDAIASLLVFVISVLVVTSRFSVNPSIGGVVLAYILGIVGMFQFAVRQLAEVENDMNSTERIYHYVSGLEEEAPLHTIDVRPTWPEHGEVMFDNVQMRYRPGLPLVLKDITMHVRAGERIGVVGRTGAGKSSIMGTLFRLVELSGGSITIDGINISQIGLHDLRSRLAIIPQDPTLFKGTIRSNLDPFHEHTDLELWSALRQAGLVDDEAAADRSGGGRVGLDAVVDEEGLNFSLGQRQLIALARALVRGSQIILCDEATSSVDFATDQKIQRAILTGFKGKTLFCIAHRLKTVIGYDRICVMDQGHIAELGPPLEVFDQNGIFTSMCDRGGIRREDILRETFVNQELGAEGAKEGPSKAG